MTFESLLPRLPEVRGSLRENIPLAPYTWLRVGGAAQVLFMPKDEADLAIFLASTPADISVQVLGVASNTLVRDGGVAGVTIRLGPGFGKIDFEAAHQVRAGAAVLDGVLARKAAQNGISGMEFLSGIPGTIGGALRMNAGCYGSETKDILIEAVALDRRGQRHVLSAADMGYGYRSCAAPADLIFTQALFQGAPDKDGAALRRIEEISVRREQTQPIREKTGGSTFKNPDPDHSGGRSAWQVVDAVCGRGYRVGGAQMSEQHCNFMINTGTASALDLESLGEEIRRRAKAQLGIDLHWEVKRLGLLPPGVYVDWEIKS